MNFIKIRNFNVLLKLHHILYDIHTTKHIYPKIDFGEYVRKYLIEVYGLNKYVIITEDLLIIIQERYKKELIEAKLPLTLKEFKANNYKLN